MDVDPLRVRSFATPDEFADWLKANHADAPELWIKMFKKGSGLPSITWQEAVIEAVAWGWIDGIKKSNDDTSWFQRFTRRKPTSGWSKKNCDYAEELIAQGRMQPQGLAMVALAKEKGIWDKAYSGQSDLVIPEDFLAAVAKDPVAQKTFDGLPRSSLFSIYHRLHSAKMEKTRQSRFGQILDALSRGEKPT